MCVCVFQEGRVILERSLVTEVDGITEIAWDFFGLLVLYFFFVVWFLKSLDIFHEPRSNKNVMLHLKLNTLVESPTSVVLVTPAFHLTTSSFEHLHSWPATITMLHAFCLLSISFATCCKFLFFFFLSFYSCTMMYTLIWQILFFFLCDCERLFMLFNVWLERCDFSNKPHLICYGRTNGLVFCRCTALVIMQLTSSGVLFFFSFFLFSILLLYRPDVCLQF